MVAHEVLTEQWFADVLQDSLDMDWTSSDGARAIMRALGELSTPTSQPPAAETRLREVVERIVYNALTRQALRPQDSRDHIANLAASIIMEIISATPQPTETQRVVAWLRDDYRKEERTWRGELEYLAIAECIERGVHMAGEK